METPIEIRPFSFDAPRHELAAGLELRRVLEHEQFPGDPQLPEAELIGELSSSTDVVQRRFLVAWSGSEAVGIAEAELQYLDTNRDRCAIEIGVHPAHRRHGVGRALASHVLDLVADDGRRLTAAWGPISDENDGFWPALGADLRLTEQVSRLELAAVDSTLMAQWIDDRTELAADLELVGWVGRCPDEHIAAYAEMKVAMNDAPLEDLDWDDEALGIEQMRSFEDSYIRRGSEIWALIVIDPATGAAVAHTEAQVKTHRPRVSAQWDTVVIPAYRGRRIGRWIKAEMWQRLRRHRPEVEILDTGNAAVNEHMLAINHAMGYRYLASYGVWQGETEVMAGRAAQPATGEPG